MLYKKTDVACLNTLLPDKLFYLNIICAFAFADSITSSFPSLSVITTASRIVFYWDKRTTVSICLRIQKRCRLGLIFPWCQGISLKNQFSSLDFSDFLLPTFFCTNTLLYYSIFIVCTFSCFCSRPSSKFNRTLYKCPTSMSNFLYSILSFSSNT